jgi:hypothetical protein
MCRRLLQSFEKCIEGCLGEHMNLIDDINTVFSYLRKYSHFINKAADVINRIIGCGIELVYVEGTGFIKRLA